MGSSSSDACFSPRRTASKPTSHRSWDGRFYTNPSGNATSIRDELSFHFIPWFPTLLPGLRYNSSSAVSGSLHARPRKQNEHSIPQSREKFLASSLSASQNWVPSSDFGRKPSSIRARIFQTTFGEIFCTKVALRLKRLSQYQLCFQQLFGLVPNQMPPRRKCFAEARLRLGRFAR